MTIEKNIHMIGQLSHGKDLAPHFEKLLIKMENSVYFEI